MIKVVLIRDSIWLLIHLATIIVGFICIYDCLMLSFCSLFLLTSGWIGIYLCIIDIYLVLKTKNYTPKRGASFFVSCIKFTTTLLHFAISGWNIAGSIYILKFLSGNLTGINYTGKCLNLFTYAGIYLIVFWVTYTLGIFVVHRSNVMDVGKKKKTFVEETEMLNVNTDVSTSQPSESASASLSTKVVNV